MTSDSEEAISKIAEYKAVGHIKDAHGIKGEIFVRLFAKAADWLDQLQDVRLRSRDSGQVLTFKIERLREHKDGLVILLNGVSDRNRAEELKGLTFEISEQLLESKEGEDIFLNEVLGFRVEDKELGEIGVVKDFATNGSQDLLVVDYKNREILIPFIKEFIDKIDYKERKINMCLPEGLCDLM